MTTAHSEAREVYSGGAEPENICSDLRSAEPSPPTPATARKALTSLIHRVEVGQSTRTPSTLSR